MKTQKIIDSIRLSWKAQTLQFDYPFHAKRRVILWHVAAISISLLLCYIHPYIGIGAIPCMISWNYLFLFDKKRRVYKDSYSPKRYEYIGTLFATIIISIVLLGIITEY